MSSVDVVVPCYRYGRFLRQCVGSIVSQEGVEVRALVIDDASPDDTFEVASELAREYRCVEIIRHRSNRGHIATYNEGLEWAEASYALLLSADDYLLPGALASASSIMDVHSEVGLAFGRAIPQRGSTTPAPPSPPPSGSAWRILSGPAFIEMSGPRNIVATPTALVRTSLQKMLGDYRHELPHSGDMEMWLRFAANGSVASTDRYQAVQRQHDANMSLAYFGDGRLRDVKQREAAFAFFFQAAEGKIPHLESLQRRLIAQLSREAVRYANNAISLGDIEAAAALAEYAKELDPEITSSAPWLKLKIKGALPSPLVRNLRTARDRLARFRGAAPSHRLERLIAKVMDGRIKPRLTLACRVLGNWGQPWLWRQVKGLEPFRKDVICWERHDATSRDNDIDEYVLSGDPAPYDGDGRWLYRLRNAPAGNFYAALGRDRAQLERRFESNRPDLLLCYFGDIAMRVLPVARHMLIPIVAYLHGEFTHTYNRWYRWSLSKCARQFSALVVVTEAEKEWLLTLGVPPKRIHVIPCGAPIASFKPKPARADGLVRFVMASRLSPDKGCSTTLQAFARVAARETTATLDVFGDGPDRAALEFQVREHHLEDRIRFHGHIENAVLSERLPDFDVFLQHSLKKEGSPVSIVEAMACGLPVVATPVGGIVDQVIPEHNGLLVNEQDVDGMAAAMLRLARDADLCQTFGRAGRTRAMEKYDADRQTQRLADVLLEVIAATSKRPQRVSHAEPARQTANSPTEPRSNVVVLTPP
jgi:glycosyltransferase involved in cell wall biosynthesis